MFSIQSLLVLMSLIGCGDLITVTTPQKYVNVTKGEDALLQCMYITTEETTTSLTIQWEFDSSTAMTPKQICFYQSGKVAVTSSYEGRIQPPSTPETTRNASILISNMKPSDAGVYSCDVHNFPDVEGRSQVNIIVNVLERPSVPYCSVHGEIETGSLVTLTCHSEHGSPKPVYSWTRLDEKKTRTSMLATPTGVLRINITELQFGEYQCKSSNVLGFATCTIELSPEVGDGVIAGAVIGALLGCVLIALVVWFIVHTVKKHNYKAVKAAEATETQRSPPQVQDGTDGIPMATTSAGLHTEEDEA